jgi:N-dimethylarginine dimethylaminohydrolase
MEWTEAVDVRRAIRQWSSLATAIVDAGAQVDAMRNVSRSGAMTFTRDTAVVTAPGEALILRNVGRRGDLEPEHVESWLTGHGINTSSLDDDTRVDGGNVVPTVDGWLLGIGPGADVDSVSAFGRRLRDFTGAAVHGVPIRLPKFGHLDTALSDLAGRGWLVHPAAFWQPDLAAESWKPVLRQRPVIEVTDDEADRLACNVVVVGDHVIGGLSDRLCRAIERLDLHPVPVDLDEFRKAGGGAHCLTLELDPIHRRPDGPPAVPNGRSTRAPSVPAT